MARMGQTIPKLIANVTTADSTNGAPAMRNTGPVQRKEHDSLHTCWVVEFRSELRQCLRGNCKELRLPRWGLVTLGKVANDQDCRHNTNSIAIQYFFAISILQHRLMTASENTSHPLREQHNRNYHYGPNHPECHLRPALPAADSSQAQHLKESHRQQHDR